MQHKKGKRFDFMFLQALNATILIQEIEKKTKKKSEDSVKNCNFDVP